MCIAAYRENCYGCEACCGVVPYNGLYHLNLIRVSPIDDIIFAYPGLVQKFWLDTPRLGQTSSTLLKATENLQEGVEFNTQTIIHTGTLDGIGQWSFDNIQASCTSIIHFPIRA